MKQAVLYPFKREDIPYILSGDKIYDQYEITDVVAPCGSGLCGKDISYADNRGNFGVKVKENLEEALKKRDALLVTSGNQEKYYVGIEDAIYTALQCEKDIICNAKLSVKKRREIALLCKQKRRNFIYGQEERIQWRDVIVTGTHRLRTPIAFVTSILADANNIELMLKVKKALDAMGYNVLTVGATPEIQMYGGVYSGILDSLVNGRFQSDSVPVTIKLLNHFLWCVENQKSPDLMMLEIPGGLIETPDFPNESGTFAYIITRAVQADYVIGTTLYGNYTDDSMLKISEEIERRFGFCLNCLHVSNKMLHITSSMHKQEMQYIYMPLDGVITKNHRAGDILVGNFLEPSQAKLIAEDMVRTMGG